jgi:hypothetical protein
MRLAHVTMFHALWVGDYAGAELKNLNPENREFSLDTDIGLN